MIHPNNRVELNDIRHEITRVDGYYVGTPSIRVDRHNWHVLNGRSSFGEFRMTDTDTVEVCLTYGGRFFVVERIHFKSGIVLSTSDDIAHHLWPLRKNMAHDELYRKAVLHKRMGRLWTPDFNGDRMYFL